MEKTQGAIQRGAIQRTDILRVAGINDAKITSTTTLTTWQMFEQPLATYAIYIRPKTRDLKQSMDKLESTIIEIALGIYWEGRKARLLEVAKLNTPIEVKSLKIRAMKKRLRNRSETPTLC